MYIAMDPEPGKSIDDAAADAITIADKYELEVRFTFNGTELIARRNDESQTLVTHYFAIREQDQRRRGIK